MLQCGLLKLPFVPNLAMQPSASVPYTLEAAAYFVLRNTSSDATVGPTLNERQKVVEP